MLVGVGLAYGALLALWLGLGTRMERLAENKSDLVVLDFMMPLINGAQMGAAMRANPAYRDVPVIMISAVTEAAVRERFND